MRREDFSLRPIEESDLLKVLEWRNSEWIRANMYTDHIISIDEHSAWLERINKDETPTFMIFEFQWKPIGVVNVTQIDNRNNKCHWGFYMGEIGVPRGCGAIMGFMGLEYFFEKLNIRKICSEVFAFNKASIKYHKKLGFREEGYFLKHILKNGDYEDIVVFALLKDEWLKSKSELENICFHMGDICGK